MLAPPLIFLLQVTFEQLQDHSANALCSKSTRAALELLRALAAASAPLAVDKIGTGSYTRSLLETRAGVEVMTTTLRVHSHNTFVILAAANLLIDLVQPQATRTKSNEHALWVRRVTGEPALHDAVKEIYAAWPTRTISRDGGSGEDAVKTNDVESDGGANLDSALKDVGSGDDAAKTNDVESDGGANLDSALSVVVKFMQSLLIGQDSINAVLQGGGPRTAIEFLSKQPTLEGHLTAVVSMLTTLVDLNCPVPTLVEHGVTRALLDALTQFIGHAPSSMAFSSDSAMRAIAPPREQLRDLMHVLLVLVDNGLPHEEVPCEPFESILTGALCIDSCLIMRLVQLVEAGVIRAVAAVLRDCDSTKDAGEAAADALTVFNHLAHAETIAAAAEDANVATATGGDTPALRIIAGNPMPDDIGAFVSEVRAVAVVIVEIRDHWSVQSRECHMPFDVNVAPLSNAPQTHAERSLELAAAVLERNPSQHLAPLVADFVLELTMASFASLTRSIATYAELAVVASQRTGSCPKAGARRASAMAALRVMTLEIDERHAYIVNSLDVLRRIGRFDAPTAGFAVQALRRSSLEGSLHLPPHTVIAVLQYAQHGIRRELRGDQEAANAEQPFSEAFVETFHGIPAIVQTLCAASIHERLTPKWREKLDYLRVHVEAAHIITHLSSGRDSWATSAHQVSTVTALRSLCCSLCRSLCRCSLLCPSLRVVIHSK